MVTCKKCGKKGLAWKETLSGFMLCDALGKHECIDEPKVRGRVRDR